MAVREVLRYPHPSLKQKARELGTDDGNVTAEVAADLVDTMASFGHCVGLGHAPLGADSIMVEHVTGLPTLRPYDLADLETLYRAP